jgi:hypothetical protein
MLAIKISVKREGLKVGAASREWCPEVVFCEKCAEDVACFSKEI